MVLLFRKSKQNYGRKLDCIMVQRYRWLILLILLVKFLEAARYQKLLLFNYDNLVTN